VTTTVGYDYDSEGRSEELEEFLRGIQPEEVTLKWMLKRTSDGLDGRKPNTIIVLLIGEGSNGKSQYFNLCQERLECLGERWTYRY